MSGKTKGRSSCMSHDDVLFRYRLRLFTLAEELANVSEACRRMGVSRQTYYRLKHRVDRWGLEALRVRERRRARQPNEIGPHLEQRIVAFSLAHPGFGPRRISAELAREQWGGIRISEHGVWRLLPVTATHTSELPHRRLRSVTSRPLSPASSCRPTASSSGGCPVAKELS